MKTASIGAWFDLPVYSFKGFGVIIIREIFDGHFDGDQLRRVILLLVELRFQPHIGFVLYIGDEQPVSEPVE